MLRDGHRVRVPARELVPGDIVFLETGNFVPADVRLLEAVNLSRRSRPHRRIGSRGEERALVLDRDISLGDRKNTAFMGTVVTYGRGQGVVVSTGMHTQLGLIATMLQSVEEEETPLQRRLDQLGKTLGFACLIICAIVFGAGWLQGGNPLDIFMIAVSLAIAAVPEGLPAIVTISLALGMREMVKRHALIRRLSSVETLGSATVICSDKTGTLTQNDMTVTRVWVDGKALSHHRHRLYPGRRLHGRRQEGGRERLPRPRQRAVGRAPSIMTPSSKNCEEERTRYRIVGDPTEGSILVAAAKAGASPGAEQSLPARGRSPL